MASLSAPVVGRVVGPLVFLILMLTSGGDLSSSGKRVVAVVLWMAVWWMTEAAPLAVTAMLPLVMFPPGGLYRDEMIHALESAGRRWRVSYLSASLASIGAAVADGLGVSLLPRFMAPGAEDGVTLRMLKTAPLLPDLQMISPQPLLLRAWPPAPVLPAPALYHL